MGTHTSTVPRVKECDFTNGDRDATKTVARGAVQPLRSQFRRDQECLATTLYVLTRYGVQCVEKCTHVHMGKMAYYVKYGIVRQTVDAQTFLLPSTISF